MATGTCQRCGAALELELVQAEKRKVRRIPAHERENGWQWDDQVRTAIAWRRCEGSGQSSREAREAHRARRLKQRREAVERARGDAVVALDLHIRADGAGGVDLAGWIERLLELAFDELRIRFGLRGPLRAWFPFDGQRTLRFPRRRTRVDIYCTFCRCLIRQRAMLGYDYTEMTRSHTTTCALRCLAGLIEPVAPGTYRLPAELRQDGEAVP